MGRLNYSLRGIKSPVDQSVKYYAIKELSSRVPSEEVIKRIAENSKMSAGMVEASVSAILDSVANFVANGHSVQLGDFASLRPLVVSKKATSFETLSARNARGVRVRVAWGTGCRFLQNKMNYEFDFNGKVKEAPTNN